MRKNMNLIKRLMSVLKVFGTILIITFALLLLIEFSLSFLGWLEKNDKVDSRSKMSVYDNDWGEKFWQEYPNIVMSQSYKPFYLWAVNPAKSNYVNVDDNGNRRTINPNFNNIEKSEIKEVFIFGGSTVWGAGSPDSMTIASYLSEELNAQNLKFSVFNKGQPGHTQTQEIIQLITLLKRGNRPDYVIFLDGANDSSMSLINPKDAYSHLRFNHTRDVFNLDFAYLKMHYLGSLNLYQLALKISQYGRESVPLNIVETNREKFLEESRTLINDAQDNIHTNYILMQALSKAYDFKFRIFLQPTIASKKDSLTSEEKIIWEKYRNDKVIFEYDAFHQMYNDFDYFKYPKIINISQIFDGVSITTFIDPVHYSPEGNQLLANEIAKFILK